jgi:hypothetical protein
MALKYTPPGWNGGDPTLSSSFPGYTAVTINNDGSNRSQNLTAGVDYYLNISDYNPTVANLGGLTITGGRNVIIVGGRMRINNIAASPTQSSQTALKIKPGATGTYFIEGLDIGGTQLNDAIAIQSGGGATTSSVIQIQNCYIQNALPLAAGQTPAQALAAGMHPDGLQFQTAFPGLVQFYQNTIATTYQGIFVKNEGGGQNGITSILRTNIRPILEPTGTKTAHYLFWQELATECPVQFPTSFSGFDDVYVNEDLTQSTFSFLTEMYPDGSGGTRPGDDYTATTDGTGTYATWNAGANITGRVYKGLPVGGDYVVNNGGTGGASIPGIAYVSPGYGSTLGGYTPTTWVNDTTPALNATNLNHLTDELQLQAASIDPPISNSLPNWVNGSGAALSDATPLNEMERVADLLAASLGLSYTPTAWSTGWTPARNAANLNKLENAVAASRVALDAGAGNPYLEAIFLNGKYSPSLSTVFAAYGTDSHIKDWGGLETTLPGNLGYDEVASDNAITPIAKDPAERVSLRATPVNPNGTGWVSRQEIRTTDGPWNPTGGSSYDKATSRPLTSLDVALTAGLVRWFSWDYFLPLNFGASNDTFNWCVGGAGNVFHTLMDLHLNGSQYEQVWNILEGVIGPIGNNNVYFRFHMGAHEGGSDPAPSDTEFVNVLQLTNNVGARVAASYNVWHKLVVGVKHNSDGGVGTSSGWVDIWHDGVNILPQHSRPTIFPNQTQEWQQMQNYKNHDGPLFGGATSSVIYYGGIRAGLTRTDVM